MRHSTEVETTQGPGSIAMTSSTVRRLSRSGAGRTRSSLLRAPSVAGGEGIQADLAQGTEAEREGEGLFVAEQERRDAEAGFETIGSADAARGGDGDVEVFEADDVALHGAQVDFEAFGEFVAGDEVARLQDFKDRERAHDGVVHDFRFYFEFTTRAVGNGGLLSIPCPTTGLKEELI